LASASRRRCSSVAGRPSISIRCVSVMILTVADRR
jgi:hypothetical protein